MNSDLERLLKSIQPIDEIWLRRAELRQDQLTKPPGSLGRLEQLANQVCAIQRTLQPNVDNAAILVFAGDHGVCSEGMNTYPQEVTRQMVLNFLDEGAAINAIARSVQARLIFVDVGVAGVPIEDPRLISRRVAPGTDNFCSGPAMSRDSAERAIQIGIDCCTLAIDAGASMLAIGEMGIGNTTVASALCAALTGLELPLVCGRGTASDDASLTRKQDVVRRALALHGPNFNNPLDTLIRLGGFEIAAMCGACLQAAALKVPILMDGFIATAAAALATRFHAHVADYLIASHLSVEPGHKALLRMLDREPLLDLGMRLGEGTGASLAIPIVRAAVSAYVSMATFESAGVSSTEVAT